VSGTVFSACPRSRWLQSRGTPLTRRLVPRLRSAKDVAGFRAEVAARYSVEPSSVELLDKDGQALPHGALLEELPFDEFLATVTEKDGTVKTWTFAFERRHERAEDAGTKEEASEQPSTEKEAAPASTASDLSAFTNPSGAGLVKAVNYTLHRSAIG
jgi:hypothetical protein